MAVNVQRPSGADAWLEFDGNWSTFNLQAGNLTGGQHFHVVPSLMSPTTWLVDESTCPKTTQSYKSTIAGVAVPGIPASDIDCAKKRGVGLFNSQQVLGYSPANSTGVGPIKSAGSIQIDGQSSGDLYGSPLFVTSNDLELDYLYLNNGSRSINSSIPAPIFTDSNLHFYLATIGLGPGITALDTGHASIPSLMSSLASSGAIPSQSWGYTAGASYRNEYPGSLVLGGYDSNRFAGNLNVTHKMTGQELQLQLEVQDISIDYRDRTNVQYNGASFQAIIDSSLPYLYLPPDLCNWFASQFNLKLNDSSLALGDKSTYTLSRSAATANLASADSIKISVGTTGSRSATTTITLPYSAFHSNASWVWGAYNSSASTETTLVPLAEAPPLFPIRNMTGNTAILGRAFLQEAYVHANFEPDKREFFIAPASFDNDPAETRLTTVYSKTTQPPKPSPNKLGTGAIVGIAVGVVAGLAIAALALWYFWWRPKGQKAAQEKLAPKSETGVELGATPVSPIAGTIGRDRAGSMWSDAPTEVEDSSRPKHSRHPSEPLSELSDENNNNEIWGLRTVPEHGSDDMLKYSGRMRSNQTSPQPATPLTPPERHELLGSSNWTYPDQARRRREIGATDDMTSNGSTPAHGSHASTPLPTSPSSTPMPASPAQGPTRATSSNHGTANSPSRMASSNYGSYMPTSPIGNLPAVPASSYQSEIADYPASPTPAAADIAHVRDGADSKK